MITVGDCVEVMAGMPAGSVDAIVCDPPYGLEFMGKEWDRFRVDDPGTMRHRGENAGSHGELISQKTAPDAHPARNGRGVAYGGGKRATTSRCKTCGKRDQQRAPGKACTGACNWQTELIDPYAAPPTMLAFQNWCREWALEALRVLKPGGHLLAFGGTRTYHRLACAVEDAGFEIRDCLAWMYGSGFPKSLDVSKAIDKAAGAEREVLGQAHADRYPNGPGGSSFSIGEGNDGTRTAERTLLTAPATAEAQAWQGWGTALKPSHEPVVVAQKPRDPWGEIRQHLEVLETWLAQAADSTTQTGAAADFSASMATSPSGRMAPTFLSTVTSWQTCLDEICAQMSTSTTSTESSTTTDPRTLLSCLSQITPGSITQDQSPDAGWRLAVTAADNLFAAAVLSSRATRALSAADPATGNTPTPRLDATDPEPSPAHEPIVLARKPLTGTVAGNVQAHGTGALNIDGCRIGDDAGWSYPNGRGGSEPHHMQRGERNGQADAPGEAQAGRWPANVILDPDAAAMLDQQTGELHSGANPTRRGSDKFRTVYGDFEGQRDCDAARGADSGGASRFYYVPKASSAERNAGLDGFEEQRKPEGMHSIPSRECNVCGTRTKKPGKPWPICGHDDWQWVKVREERHHGQMRNVHPTVKPVQLMRWLCRLVTPPGGTVLDPFTGSGTTGIAATLEGFQFTGIERDPEYAAIAEARIAWWAAHPDGMDLVRRLELEREAATTRERGQLDLFGGQ